MLARLLDWITGTSWARTGGAWCESKLPGEWIVYYTGDMHGIFVGAKVRGLGKYGLVISQIAPSLWRVRDQPLTMKETP